MSKFGGSADDLKALVARVQPGTQWSETTNGAHQCRCADGAVLNWWPNTRTVSYQGPKEAAKRFKDVMTPLLAGSPAGVSGGSIPPGTVAQMSKVVFVVHGHDVTAREQLELTLHRLGLDPYVLQNNDSGGLTIIEALEKRIVHGAASSALGFGIVLMTPDDVGYARTKPESSLQRARQNVVLELGMLIASLGRERVVILKKGEIELPSDAHGLIYIPFENHVKETVPKLAQRLRGAGFPIDESRIMSASQ